ncbi:MAG: hypothetical protein DSO07_10320 [Thermoproteota archaeon]|jgi:succinate dehydrogenase flavin-adding protein (antitoxin of CptAB toxin-antitoxin module)|uniref:DUF2791 family P-loop domain-containing protein n=1 Tax=Candidatus Methanodesulfokora washburnensis TaxID=2478471 RepID=A0A429GT30_9CREN|nr:BREX system ATP-binding domain-containing protein [Candidatus Methanodesulfokores washburnensis]RSN76929.1 hypothetical protein D6D85_03355 [Candidatus Methanodesulfokores washburnensis]TDA39540.1 MAG: hypothetical protein DSO07_10320 [Candidatus Korarchaeota archaeon]
MTSSAIDPVTAKKIIEIVGSSGTPPEYGFQYFTSGLDIYLNTIEKEYLKDFIKGGGSAFKMVIGAYGEGKTHFLYSIRELAWKHGYATSYIVLRPEETPFHRMDLVYKSVVENLVYPQPADKLLSSDYDKGIETIIKKWYMEKYNEISRGVGKIKLDEELRAYANSLGRYDSISFRNAVKKAFLALLDRHDEDFYLILQWLKGENPPKNKLNNFNIFEKIDKSTAFKMLRSLVQWLSDIGYSGLIVLMDEAEPVPSMSSKQKSILLNNLRELIDECGQASFGRTMWFYAVPDESFLNGRTSVYEALSQRVSTVFDAELNPTGVKIYLERIPMELLAHLKEIGEKLARIYEVAYGKFEDRKSLDETIENIAKAAYEEKWKGGYKRFFVQNIIKAMHILRRTGKAVKFEDLKKEQV